MSTWIEKAKTKFSITLGDGQVYYPLSMNANKSVEFNISEFNFRNLDGTLVNKRRRMGTTYDLTMIFQGGDHLDKAQAFQKSSYNTKPWSIQHPYYGVLGVQPITPVSYDNNNQAQGTTIIKVTVRETLNYKQVTNTQAPADAIADGQQSTARHYATYFVTKVATPTVKDVQQMKKDLNGVQNILKNISAGYTDIINAYNKTNIAINAAIGNVTGYANAVQAYLLLPALIAGTAVARVQNLANIEGYFAAQFSKGLNADIKALLFLESGAVMGAMCLASVSNLSSTDYQYSNQVTGVISTIISSYNAYILGLDVMQTATGNEPGSWAADPDSIIALDNLLYLTLSTLFTIQANSKQAKYVTLTRPNNVITVAWQIYGLVSDDSTIDKLIADNNWGGNMLLQIPQGTQVLYYA